MFYLKLAWKNLKTSPKQYLPFVMASLVLYVLVTSTNLILSSPTSDKMKFGVMTLNLALIVLIIFSVIIELYSYSFLMKQRSREFGLYNILGMNKKQVSLVSTIELIILWVGTVVLGTLLSSVFANFFYLIFVHLIQYDQLNFSLTISGLFLPILIFGVIFILLWIVGTSMIGKSSPLMLFRNQEQAEKEPKANIFLAFLGLAILSTGYYLSLTSEKKDGLSLVSRFFIAVLCVVFATYLFYISFTTWYLKRKKANKKYFYQPEHFISTSQMLFRMKKNAVGLANITLLAVMSFVTIMVTSSIYVGFQQSVKEKFPENTQVLYQVSDRAEGQELMQKTIQEPLANKVGPQISYQFFTRQVSVSDQGGVLNLSRDAVNPTNIAFPVIVTQEDLRKFGNSVPHLDKDQIALYGRTKENPSKQLNLFGQTYEIRHYEDVERVKLPEATNLYNAMVIVVSDDQVLANIAQSGNGEGEENHIFYTSFVHLTDTERTKVATAVKKVSRGEIKNNKGEAFPFAYTGYLENDQEFRESSLLISGGFLFTGFLLGLAFLLGAALIIYYKQYTEGHEDKKSYRILQEVGMSKSFVKRIINSQTIFVFFMPLVFAILHFVMAMPMLLQMLSLFAIKSSSLIYIVSLLTILVIILIYYLIYRLTSRVYYQIVER
ncbi:ABC transporter permease [Streptococcus sp. DD13]|uniref:ABC transporter permease n=1 Tax=Streptococcus sp. DD13 TaxID=1777881 RepID=UPI0007977899|nr:ABC transporter permease [Streptococcus sp. DD13]KXT78784.1 ABC transporter permease protein [Streptococcus sp. DD13]